MFCLSDQSVFILPEVGENAVSGPTNLPDVFIEENEKNERQLVDKADNSETSLNAAKYHVDNLPEKRIGRITRDSSQSTTDRKKADVLSIIPEANSEKDNLANHVRDDKYDNEAGNARKSSKDFQIWEKRTPSDFDEGNVVNKNGELVFLNGVDDHEDLRFTGRNLTEDVKEKPELVTVKEGYNISSPKQQVTLVNESRDNVRLNDVSHNENSVGSHENDFTEQQETARDKTNEERGSDKFASETTVKENVCARTVDCPSSARSVNSSNKSQTPLEMGDVSLAFDRSETRKEDLNSLRVSSSETGPEESAKIAPKRPQKFEGYPENSNNVNDLGNVCKTDSLNQSEKNKASRDIGPTKNVRESDKNSHVAQDSPWITRQLQPDAEKQIEEKGNYERKNKRKRSAPENEKPERIVPRLMIDQSNVSERNENEKLERDEDEEDKPRKRRASEPGLQFEPLSPLMEAENSNNDFLNTTGAQSGKVKRNKSFVSRGLSKMFGGKRKYKAEKDSLAGPVDFDKISTHEESDFKVNRREKKKKKKDKGDQKNVHEGLSPENIDKSPSRKFGGLFSRGKKKEKSFTGP